MTSNVLSQVITPLSIKKVQKIIKNENGEKIEKFHLHHLLLGSINLLKKTKTTPSSTRKMPAIVLITGLQTGMESVHLVPALPETAIIGIEYPIPKDLRGQNLAFEVIKGMVVLQSQIASTLIWLTEQPDIDSEKISLVMVSFGSIAAPKSIALAQKHGFKAKATIFAFGGAEIRNFIFSYLKIPDAPAGSLLLLDHYLSQIDPIKDLPYLIHSFAVIYGSNDNVIPLKSTQIV